MQKQSKLSLLALLLQLYIYLSMALATSQLQPFELSKLRGPDIYRHRPAPWRVSPRFLAHTLPAAGGNIYTWTSIIDRPAGCRW